MNDKISRLHERAVAIAATHIRSEAELIGVLQEIDLHRAYLHYGARSLYDYCERILKLSEGTSYNLITVARRANQVPALKQAVESGKISVSKARKIAPVLNRENQDAWLELAATKSSREIEREVAKANPQAPQPERFQYTSGDNVRAQLDIPEPLMKKLRRIQDLESQRRGLAATFIEALEAATDVFLERNDPVAKAERAIKRHAKTNERKAHGSASMASGDVDVSESAVTATRVKADTDAETSTQRDWELVPGRVDRTAFVNGEPIPAFVKHRVFARDKAQCTYTDDHGRCSTTRWLHIHHIVAREDGGSNELENLRLLCERHHRFVHMGSRVQSPAVEYRAS